MGDFGDKFSEILSRYDDDFATKSSALNRESEAKLAFLEEFRDVAENIVIPVMQNAKDLAKDSESVNLNIAREWPETIRLTAEVARLDSRGAQRIIKYSLTLRAEFHRKRAILYLSKGDSGSIPETTGEFRLTEVSKAEVESRIILLMQEIAKPGSGE